MVVVVKIFFFIFLPKFKLQKSEKLIKMLTFSFQLRMKPNKELKGSIL